MYSCARKYHYTCGISQCAGHLEIYDAKNCLTGKSAISFWLSRLNREIWHWRQNNELIHVTATLKWWRCETECWAKCAAVFCLIVSDEEQEHPKQKHSPSLFPVEHMQTVTTDWILTWPVCAGWRRFPRGRFLWGCGRGWGCWRWPTGRWSPRGYPLSCCSSDPGPPESPESPGFRDG